MERGEGGGGGSRRRGEGAHRQAGDALAMDHSREERSICHWIASSASHGTRGCRVQRGHVPHRAAPARPDTPSLATLPTQPSPRRAREACFEAARQTVGTVREVRILCEKRRGRGEVVAWGGEDLPPPRGSAAHCSPPLRCRTSPAPTPCCAGTLCSDEATKITFGKQEMRRDTASPAVAFPPADDQRKWCSSTRYMPLASVTVCPKNPGRGDLEGVVRPRARKGRQDGEE